VFNFTTAPSNDMSVIEFLFLLLLLHTLYELRQDVDRLQGKSMTPNWSREDAELFVAVSALGVSNIVLTTYTERFYVPLPEGHVWGLLVLTFGSFRLTMAYGSAAARRVSAYAAVGLAVAMLLLFFKLVSFDPRVPMLAYGLLFAGMASFGAIQRRTARNAS
jgi:hypothetical protein